MTNTVLLGLTTVLLWVGCAGHDDGTVQQIQQIQQLADNLCAEYAAHGYSGHQLPVNGFCELYIQCGARSALQVCPTGHFFNGQACVLSDQANCPHDPCLGKLDGEEYWDGQTCSGFYVCMGGLSHHRNCYNGYSYSPAGCVADDTCHSNLIADFSSCDADQYLASPQHPGVYFQRVPGGNYVKRPCPEGLVFDTSVCVCNYPPGSYIGYHETGHTDGGYSGKGGQHSTY